MAMMINQRRQLLQSLGSIATSAANAVADGIAEATKTDSKTADTALKLFGGFDRSEFENIGGTPVPDDGMPNLLVPAVLGPRHRTHLYLMMEGRICSCLQFGHPHRMKGLLNTSNRFEYCRR